MQVVIYGAGGHGKVVADILTTAGVHEVVGFVDDNERFHGTRAMGLSVLGGKEWLHNVASDGKCGVVLGIGDNKLRKRVAAQCQGLMLVIAIHPAATVSKAAHLGEGTVVMAGAVINPGAEVGRGVIINSGAVIEHDVTLGDYAHISPNATMGGGCRLGEESHLGLGAVILPGLAVGRRTVIGAGAVVIRDVPDDVVAVGVPAHVVDTAKA